MRTKAFQESTCEFTEHIPYTDWVVYHYNSGVFENGPAETEVVHWPLTKNATRRHRIATFMFEQFYPLYIMSKLPDGKILSCDLSYNVQSRGEFVERYCMYTLSDETVISKTIVIDKESNDELLLQFEDWFRNDVLPIVIENST